MELVEIRDLDGPNLFRMEPIMKVELAFAEHEARDVLFDTVKSRIVALHGLLGLPAPSVSRHTVDAPEHGVLAFDWRFRSCAAGIALVATDIALDPNDAGVIQKLHERLEHDRESNDGPLWIRESERDKPAVGITGTNGKTTTTRLLAHIASEAGKRVGWSSSTGVYLNGVRVMQGDYSGPSGARRVLEDPDIELAILETARGGLLLRGLAYESNDVGVFLNVSADHLSLQGVETQETLAEVKSIVVRSTRPEGLVVLNADDSLVLSFKDRVRAPVMLISQDSANPAVRAHVTSGGRALVRDGDALLILGSGEPETLTSVADIPMAYGGAAPFMVENALAASAAALGLGFAPDQIAASLATFRNDSQSNRGRLNVFDVEGRTVIIDYAHNDIGLEGLARFSRAIGGADARLHVIVGTAGDRRDDDFQALGAIAGRLADVVYLKDTQTYLRGRTPGEMTARMRAGFEAAGGASELAGEFCGEFEAYSRALELASPGDVIAVMCQVDQDRIIEDVRQRGGHERVTKP